MKMPIRFTIGDTSGVVDPHRVYKNRLPGRLLEACGLIPYFTLDMGDDPMTTEEVLGHMTEQYGFGDLPLFEGSINDLGVYRSKYDDDMPLYPYVRITRNECDIYIYPYGIVGIDGRNGPQLVVRMD